jgi:hypothetical protein
MCLVLVINALLIIDHCEMLLSIAYAGIVVVATIIASSDLPNAKAFSPSSSSLSLCTTSSAVMRLPIKNYFHHHALGQQRSPTALGLLELHVLGYAKTKLPFIHPDDGRGGGGGGQNTRGNAIFQE